MFVTTTELQNNFGKYLKLCERHSIIVTKNGKKRALLLPFPRGAHGYAAAEPAQNYGTSARKSPSVSYREYLELVENSEQRYEYIDGEVYLMGSPGVTHQRVLGRMYDCFRRLFPGEAPTDYTDRRGCELFLAPFDTWLYRLPIGDERDLTEDDTNVVQPDLLVLCDHHDTVDENDRYKGTPTLVVEILSPSTRSKDMIHKLYLYSESGIREYWIVDPSSRTISIYGFAGCAMQNDSRHGPGQTAVSPTFPRLRVPVDEMFE